MKAKVLGSARVKAAAREVDRDRPGSGIAAPSLVREVKPQYTEEARRLGVEGDVVLEIVVRSDGSVGQVSIVQRLGSGLDQRAVDAVRQWRFSPARRHGTPVDVLVEVAVEFKLRRTPMNTILLSQRFAPWRSR